MRLRRLLYLAPAAAVLAAPALMALALLAGSGACIASAPEGIVRQTADDGGGGGFNTDTGLPDPTKPDSAPLDPHAVLGANPPHGPFSGGQRVLIQGKGFASDVRVWFGEAEVDPTTIVAIDPTRVQ